MGSREEEVAALVRQSEAILDSVLSEQLRKAQQQQQQVLNDLLEVEKLRDHIPLLRLQQQHVGERQQRLDAALERLRIRPSTPQPLQQQQQLLQPSQQQQQQQQHRRPFPLKCLADVGSHCYMPAVASDASRLLVSVGFNFYLEMDLHAAELFLKKKRHLLRQKHELCSLKVARLKTQMRLVSSSCPRVCKARLSREQLVVHPNAWATAAAAAAVVSQLMEAISAVSQEPMLQL
ncbi:hypothetical protein Esti_004384 [Eimeria stiedai]